MSGLPTHTKTAALAPFAPVAATLVLVVVAVPVAERLCDLRREAVAAAAQSAGGHCPAHRTAPKGAPQELPPDPCGHAHASEGVLLTASASIGRSVPAPSASLATPKAPLSPLATRLPLCRENFLRIPVPGRARPAPPILRL
jgi:hypothetical protein